MISVRFSHAAECLVELRFQDERNPPTKRKQNGGSADAAICHGFIIHGMMQHAHFLMRRKHMSTCSHLLGG
ncbi:hypothetical protein OPV22_016066 [Ensete ventricosum]|uniref:Uncharacterized protein n=1 Tax=Ensete ventricosum TaxID=4639 RepID=A0AAV8PDQ4_ENSVE|nr:hypothetical protein OPV22_016066 [Ensete ventricosum]